MERQIAQIAAKTALGAKLVSRNEKDLSGDYPDRSTPSAEPPLARPDAVSPS
jgi:hypothetical protein